MHTLFWLETLKERDLLEDLGVDGKILQWKQDGKVWIGHIGLRMGTRCELLWTR